jgi:hypothetical protein
MSGLVRHRASGGLFLADIKWTQKNPETLAPAGSGETFYPNEDEQAGKSNCLSGVPHQVQNFDL